MNGARDITQLCFSSNLTGIVANKIEQSFYSVYSYSGIESIERAVNPRSLLEKIATRSLEGGGGGQSDTPLSTFDTIHPIDLKFGTHNKVHLYFQLSETMWCLINFHVKK